MNKLFTQLAAPLAAMQMMSGAAFGGALDGNKTIRLMAEDGDAVTIAEVAFSAEDGRTAYKIDWADEPFADHFLSMRPFKCLESAAKHWCRVPYPYEIRRVVSTEDLTDLEYDLLFVWKDANEYGINLWNGVYYILSIEGDRLVGHIHEMDMDMLGVPPDAGELRPIAEKHLEEGDPESHWLPRVVIE
ncbi:MAG: hypothetical protein AAF479_01970 [Pseudomonadota bacterium]